MVLNHWGSDCDREKERAGNNKHQILEHRVHTYGAQVVIPTSVFAHLQNIAGVGADSDQGAELPDSNSQMRGFYWPYSQVWSCSSKERNHSPTHCGECLQALSDQKD